MLERLILSVIVILLTVVALLALRYLHMRRASGAMSQGRDVPGRPTLLYFRSDSCGPCVTQASYLRSLETAFAGRLAVRSIDADIERDTAKRYGVFTLPTTLIIDQGGEVKHINYGLTGTTKLTQQLENVL